MHLQLPLLFLSKQLIQQDINVPSTTADVDFNVGFTHTYLSDVEMEIVSPQGTTVKLFDRSCASTNSTLLLKYDLGGDIVCGTTTLQNVAPFSH
jgi:subtilisin-like proprotein convertase family protein